MTSDYEAIMCENRRRYGTDIGRFGWPLLANLYAEQTHFIFELLQNAEDALARRVEWTELRAVYFDLTETELRVSHYGDPFNEDDVRGICGIDESSKEFNDIGRFGVGFKSVYAFTERPEIHSGAEDFAIENFVHPVAASVIERSANETVIQIPFNKPNANLACGKIAAGLKQLGVGSLLFLRQIEEIAWEVEGGAWGVYLRESQEVDSGIRHITIIGQQEGESEISVEWLVFSSPVAIEDGGQTKPVEIAFICGQGEKDNSQQICRLNRSPLVVFFPTAVETHLGFLVQGPYRTTPGRDNIARDDDWNIGLVDQTVSLLRHSLCWLRDRGLLDTDALGCLPLDSSKFDDTSMFAPLFEGAKEALRSEPLLPRADGGYAAATRARLGGTKILRDLLSPTQLTMILGEKEELVWLSDDISRDRTPALHDYLVNVLKVPRVTPETIVRCLKQAFLEAQSDDWILYLYEFLRTQRGLQGNSWFERLPLIRLEDGGHVRSKNDGKFLAFLPTEATTDFPTVRKSVCATEPARAFLKSLGLKEPDLVDDVIVNVLSKYQRSNTVGANNEEYEKDIQRILRAFETDSSQQRAKLIRTLKSSKFIRAVDAGNDSKRYACPDKVYLATEQLKGLFRGVKGVLFVDNSLACLKEAKSRDLLKKCGVAEHLRPIPADNTLSFYEQSQLREKSGQPETSNRKDKVKDCKLQGLEELLAMLPNFDVDRQKEVAELLWAELAHLEESLFTGAYTWSFYGNYEVPFDAAFVKNLNEKPWVPGADGKLHRSEFVLFDSLGWPEKPFLKSKIHFKLPDIEVLVKKTGISLEMVELIKEIMDKGFTEDEVREYMNSMSRQSKLDEPSSSETGGSKGRDLEHRDTSGTNQVVGASGEWMNRGRHGGGGRSGSPGIKGRGNREFISYVAVRPEDGEPDPDNLDHESRMELEAKAIAFILVLEPDWQRTPPNTAGYDLEKVTGAEGRRLCEVKAMRGSLENRPVGLSRTQFDFARKHGESYWLYVVEYAGDDGEARIVRIQDPVGKARSFTFDRGWREVAEAVAIEEVDL